MEACERQATKLLGHIRVNEPLHPGVLQWLYWVNETPMTYTSPSEMPLMTFRVFDYLVNKVGKGKKNNAQHDGAVAELQKQMDKAMGYVNPERV